MQERRRLRVRTPQPGRFAKPSASQVGEREKTLFNTLRGCYTTRAIPAFSAPSARKTCIAAAHTRLIADLYAAIIPAVRSQSFSRPRRGKLV